jgi:hypothetical protein
MGMPMCHRESKFQYQQKAQNEPLQEIKQIMHKCKYSVKNMSIRSMHV